jgi:hypothetical protein
MMEVSEETKAELKKVLDEIYDLTAAHEVGTRWCLHQIAKRYGITLKKAFKKLDSKDG